MIEPVGYISETCKRSLADNSRGYIWPNTHQQSGVEAVFTLSYVRELLRFAYEEGFDDKRMCGVSHWAGSHIKQEIDDCENHPKLIT